MTAHRSAVTALTTLALVAGSLLSAEDKGSEHLEKAAKKLKLSDKQKQHCTQCCAEFHKKADPLVKQLCTLRDEEWQAMGKVFTKEQREKLPAIYKKLGEKELETVAKKLSLTDEQKSQVKTIREGFWKQFLKISGQKDENMASKYYDLWLKTYADIAKVLKKEQRAKLSAVMKQDFEEWHDFAFRPETLKEVEDQLSLGAAQRKQIKDLCAAYDKKMEKPMANLKQLCKEHCASLEKGLTPDQRSEVHHMFPLKHLDE